jgi:hypothetical protein
MTVKSSLGVAARQQSWRRSNHFRIERRLTSDNPREEALQAQPTSSSAIALRSVTGRRRISPAIGIAIARRLRLHRNVSIGVCIAELCADVGAVVRLPCRVEAAASCTVDRAISADPVIAKIAFLILISLDQPRCKTWSLASRVCSKQITIIDDDYYPERDITKRANSLFKKFFG